MIEKTAHLVMLLAVLALAACGGKTTSEELPDTPASPDVHWYGEDTDTAPKPDTCGPGQCLDTVDTVASADTAQDTLPELGDVCVPTCGPLACETDDGCGDVCRCPYGYLCGAEKPNVCAPVCTELCQGKTCGVAGELGECPCGYCDDGNPCDGIRTCVDGQCVDTSPPIICQPVDECHVAGVCNTYTGQCTNPTGNNGARCKDDANDCNGVFTCNGGSCVQSIPANPCAYDQLCLTSTGKCVPANGLKWVLITGGTFKMGCSPGDKLCMDNEKPAHLVTLTTFGMMDSEVTELQFQTVTGSNPSVAKLGNEYPVENVDWASAAAFCKNIGGRLPTEAEWEFAARAGRATRYSCGDDPNCLDSISWNHDNASGKKHPVRQKTPSAVGLFDMAGNVFEWVNDWFDWDYYTTSAAKQPNPTGPAKGTKRVYRGGSFFDANYPFFFRVSNRTVFYPDAGKGFDLGFRCARSQ